MSSVPLSSSFLISDMSKKTQDDPVTQQESSEGESSAGKKSSQSQESNKNLPSFSASFGRSGYTGFSNPPTGQGLQFGFTIQDIVEPSGTVLSPESEPSSISEPLPPAEPSDSRKRSHEEDTANVEGTPAKTAKKGSFKCEYCTSSTSTYQTKQHLDRHLKSIHSLTRCRSCDFLAKSSKELKVHKAQQHPTPTNTSKGWLCDLCNNRYPSRIDMLIHRRTHYEHECGECTTRYYSKEQLDDHSRIFHSGEENILFECQHCGNQFQSLKDLKEHTEDAIQPKSSRKCPVCGREEENRFKLQMHYYLAGHSHYDKTELARRKPDRDDDNDKGGGRGFSNVLSVNYVLIGKTYGVLNFQKIKKSPEPEFFICKKCSKKFETEWRLRKHSCIFVRRKGKRL